MADAYMCDRCKEYFRGVGSTHLIDRIIWDETSHNPPEVSKFADLGFNIENFIDSTFESPIIHTVEFCKDCLIDMMILFVQKLRPEMQLMFPDLIKVQLTDDYAIHASDCNACVTYGD